MEEERKPREVVDRSKASQETKPRTESSQGREQGRVPIERDNKEEEKYLETLIVIRFHIRFHVAFNITIKITSNAHFRP